MQPDGRSRAADAVQMALEAGAADAFATDSTSRDVEFSYRDGALEKVQDSTSRSIALELYVAGRYSAHRTTDLEPDRLRAFIREAVALTRALEPDEYRRITPPELFAERPDVDLDLVDPAVEALAREQRLAWSAALDEASHAHGRVLSATAMVFDGSFASSEAGSNGFAGSRRSTYCWFGSSVTLRDRGDRRAEDSCFVGGTHLADLPDAQGVGTTALERAVARLDAGKGPSGRMTMVVDARAASMLVGRLLGGAYAQAVQQGRSFWAPLVGTRAFSEKLDITDDPLIVRGLASRLYDAEGISAKVLPIVKAGVVENLYVDTYYGRKAGMAPTTGSASNVRVGTGTQSLAELLRDAGEGVYVTSWLGGNADSTTGDFSLGLRGHMIENGAVGRPVGEMNVTGNLKTLFSRLEAVGNDPYPYATILSPSLVFSGVDFSGA